MCAERQVQHYNTRYSVSADNFFGLLAYFTLFSFQLAINLMVNQLLGVLSESEINEMAQLFSDFVDGCLSVPVNMPGFAYHTAMKVTQYVSYIFYFLLYITSFD